MYNEDTELIFPNRVIPELRDLRGVAWRNLVNKVSEQKETDLDQHAFVLMMARIDGCMTCNADSFRAMKGCTQCAQDAVRRYRGNDRELLSMYKEARIDVESFS